MQSYSQRYNDMDLNILNVVSFVAEEMKPHTPIRTGNLRYNSIKGEAMQFASFSVGKVYIDEDIAPYMPYTNEPWISPKWHGKKNPNEGWFGDSMVQDIAIKLARELGVRLEVHDD